MPLRNVLLLCLVISLAQFATAGTSEALQALVQAASAPERQAVEQAFHAFSVDLLTDSHPTKMAAALAAADMPQSLARVVCARLVAEYGGYTRASALLESVQVPGLESLALMGVIECAGLTSPPDAAAAAPALGTLRAQDPAAFRRVWRTLLTRCPAGSKPWDEARLRFLRTVASEAGVSDQLTSAPGFLMLEATHRSIGSIPESEALHQSLLSAAAAAKGTEDVLDVLALAVVAESWRQGPALFQEIVQRMPVANTADPRTAFCLAHWKAWALVKAGDFDAAARAWDDLRNRVSEVEDGFLPRLSAVDYFFPERLAWWQAQRAGAAEEAALNAFVDASRDSVAARSALAEVESYHRQRIRKSGELAAYESFLERERERQTQALRNLNPALLESGLVDANRLQTGFTPLSPEEIRSERERFREFDRAELAKIMDADYAEKPNLANCAFDPLVDKERRFMAFCGLSSVRKLYLQMPMGRKPAEFDATAYAEADGALLSLFSVPNAMPAPGELLGAIERLFVTMEEPAFERRLELLEAWQNALRGAGSTEILRYSNSAGAETATAVILRIAATWTALERDATETEKLDYLDSINQRIANGLFVEAISKPASLSMRSKLHAYTHRHSVRLDL